MVETVKYGNAAAIGFLGFGLTTVLLGLSYAEVFSGTNTMLLAMFIFLGGFAEVVAGAMLWKMGDTFASLAFTAFGFFWLSLATIGITAALGFGEAPDNVALGSYLIVWGIFALGMAIGALRAPRAVLALLVMLFLLFFVLGAAQLVGPTTDLGSTLITFAGWWAVINGFIGAYIAIALEVNEAMGRTVIPLFVPKSAVA